MALPPAVSSVYFTYLPFLHLREVGTKDYEILGPRPGRGEAAGHYYNDFTLIHPDYADGWYIRKAKGTQINVREMLLDWQFRLNRLDGQSATTCDLHRALETGYNKPEVGKLPHLDYKHKKGRYEHLYRKFR